MNNLSKVVKSVRATDIFRADTQYIAICKSRFLFHSFFGLVDLNNSRRSQRLDIKCTFSKKNFNGVRITEELSEKGTRIQCLISRSSDVLTS